jgi:ABC-2 type transport system permease protein
MMFPSGLWFSLAGLRPALQTLALAFPLTHVTNAAREVMLDGEGLAAIGPELITLAAMSAVLLIVGSYCFRWQ